MNIVNFKRLSIGVCCFVSALWTQAQGMEDVWHNQPDIAPHIRPFLQFLEQQHSSEDIASKVQAHVKIGVWGAVER